MVSRFDVYWVDLNPTTGSEMNKVRPAVVISPNEMNEVLKTIIIAPLTSTIRKYPFRVNVKIDGKSGQIALDQMRAIDSVRLRAKIAVLSKNEGEKVLETISEMFH